MTHHIRLALSLAMACSTAVLVSAQTPAVPQTPPRPETATAQPAPRDTAATTISGCLKLEKDVPGLTPNVAERAGVGEDFILTNVKPPAGSTSTRMMMFRIEGLSSDELKKHVNHQVELQGAIDDGASSPTSAKPGAAAGTRDSAASAKPKDFRATSLKMVSATCPSGTN